MCVCVCVCVCVCAGFRIRDWQFFFLRTLKLVFHCCGRQKSSPLKICQTKISIKAAKKSCVWSLKDGSLGDTDSRKAML